MTRLTIGYYDDSPVSGGTTRYLCDLLSALDRSRYRPVLFAPQARAWHRSLAGSDCTILTLRDDGGAPQKRAVASNRQGLRHPHLPARVAWAAGLVRETAGLVRLFRRQIPDLLHLNNTGAEPAPVAAALAGVPRIVGTWHTSPDYDLRGERQGLHYRLLEWASMQSLDRAIAVSARTRDQWSARCRFGAGYRRRIHVVHNGVDVSPSSALPSKTQARARLGLPHAAALIGCAGRLDEAKGQEYLLRALPRLCRTAPSVGVAFAGQGPQEAMLRALAERLGVADAVSFIGHVPDIRGFLAGLDIYAQPSLCEAHPYAVLEAAEASLPIVASDVGGIGETIRNGHEGLLVPPRDPDALAAALGRLLVDPAAATRMGEQARARICDEFRREAMTAGTFAVYEQVFSRRRTNPFVRYRTAPEGAA